MTSAPFELTTHEAKQRVELAYRILDKVRRRRWDFEEMRQKLDGSIRAIHEDYSLLRTVNLLDHHRDAPFEDHLAGIYRHENLEQARTRISQAISEHGLESTFLRLRDEPEHFGNLLGTPGASSRRDAFDQAELFATRLDSLLLRGKDPSRHTIDLHLEDEFHSDIRSLPEMISRLEDYRDLNEAFIEHNLAREAQAEKGLAEAAQITGDSGFAFRHLGHDIGHEVNHVLVKHPPASQEPPTRFARFQEQLDRIDDTADTIHRVTEHRDELTGHRATHQSELRAALDTIDHRRRLTSELHRHRLGLQDRLAEIYPPGALSRVRANLAHHSRLHGRLSTARHLADHPTHFGPLRGLPYSKLRQSAAEAAQRAAAHLTSFDRIKLELAKLPPRASRLDLARLRSDVHRIYRQLRDLPSIPGMQQALARTVEAVGGIGRVASHLPAPTLLLVDRALKAVRALGKGLER